MRIFILCVFIFISRVSFAQTIPLSSISTVPVDGESVFAMQSVIGGKSKWTKFKVEDLTNYIDSLFTETIVIDSTGRVFELSFLNGSVTFEDTNTQLSQAEIEDYLDKATKYALK